MQAKFIVLDASHIGFTHYNLKRNNQDAHISGITPEGVTYGFVLDGCGSRRYSEISRLVAFFLANRVQELTKVVPLSEIPEYLWGELIEFYRIQLLAMKLNPYIKDKRIVIEELIHNYFLHTVLGFVSDHKSVVVMTRGDGSITLNHAVKQIEKSNRPDYPAYFLLPWTGQSKAYAPGFETEVFALSDVHNLLVATDGISIRLMRTILAEIKEIETSTDVQMVLNREFDFGISFDDDATLAGLIRKESD